jgi:DNA-binding SARP family transcriptional activator
VTCPEGYFIDLSGGVLDLHRFEALVRQARTATAEGRADRASALFSDALGLWRGEPLSNVPSEVLHREVRPRLAEQWLLARELRIDAALAAGRHQDMTAELGELTAHHPLRERFWAQRMLALYHSGRQAEALDCYHTLSTLLAGELGIDPGPELQFLHQAVLTNDASLRSTFLDRTTDLAKLRSFRSPTGSDVARRATATSEISSTGGMSDKRGSGLLDGAVKLTGGRRLVQDLELLERERELQAFDGLIVAACGGSGQLVTVEGAAGVGKTRLLAAARAQAQRSGMRVLVARLRAGA